MWVTVLLPSDGAASAQRPAQGAPCTVAAFDDAAGTSVTDKFAQVNCVDRWGLAAGPKGAEGTLGVFRAGRGRWTEVAEIAPQSSEPGPPQFAGLAVSPAVLERLGEPFALPVRQLVDAGALVEDLAATETRLGNRGAYQASGVMRVGERDWFVLAGAGSAPPPLKDQTVGTPVYPDGQLRVYLWRNTGWALQGTVRGWMGPVDAGCCGIAALSLTGSRDPDFAITSGGAADTDWLAIVSDAGGPWHLVPFDYGYTLTTVVNGLPVGHGVATIVDATSSAAGPTTGLFERYRDGYFRPAAPPGRLPPCSRSALMAAAGPSGAVPGYLPTLDFTKFACADGWALAVGTGPGYTGQVVALFETTSAATSPVATGSWTTVELDNGDSLGSYPAIYDVPLSLLRSLATACGPSVRPELATASLVASPAMTGVAANEVAPDGVVPVDGSLWFVTETATGSTEAPGANAAVYRWSDTGWAEQGRVEDVPPSLDYFRVGYGAWFEAVTVRGAPDPGFFLEDSGSARPDVLTDTGGNWHAALYKATGQ